MAEGCRDDGAAAGAVAFDKLAGIREVFIITSSKDMTWGTTSHSESEHRATSNPKNECDFSSTAHSLAHICDDAMLLLAKLVTQSPLIHALRRRVISRGAHGGDPEKFFLPETSCLL